MKNLNHIQLKTFIHVADVGSFNKASEELYISPPAIIKQINAMENELEVTLFVRTHNGLALTDAGRCFYKDAVHLLRDFESSVERARAVAEKNDHILKIGTSPMTPGQFLVDLWPHIHPYLKDMKFQLVPFENNPENRKPFGSKIDLVVGVLDELFLQEQGWSGTLLSKEPIRLAVPVRHRLAGKDILTIDDLKGEEIMFIHRKWNSHIDTLRDHLCSEYPDIRLVTFEFYNMDAYNQCEINNCLIMTIDRWKDVHPLLKVIPVEWDFTVPFGILHAQEPSENVLKFLDAVELVLGR